MNKKYCKKLGFRLSLLSLILCVVSCNTIKENPPERSVKTKTILIYMAGNNNLSYNALENMKELEMGFVPDKEEANLVVYSHTLGATPKLIHFFKNEEGKVIRDTVYHFPAKFSATKASLTSAIQVTTTLFPAEQNGLILWSHATGWLPTGYYSSGSFSTQAFSYGGEHFSFESPWEAYPGGIDPYAEMVKSFGADNDSKVEIEIVDLVKALPHKFNFVIFDACLMGGIETAYQLKDSTDYIVFSPAEVLSAGFHYAGMMQYLFEEPTNLKGMAQNVYDHYNSQGNLSQRAATISVVKCSELSAVALAAKTIFEKYRQNIQSLDVTKVQPYFRSNKHWFYDINDFMQQVTGSEGAADVAVFTQALEKAVIYKAATARFLDITINPAKYSGISTYIPNPYKADLVEFYRKYEWEKVVGMTTELPKSEK